MSQRFHKIFLGIVALTIIPSYYSDAAIILRESFSVNWPLCNRCGSWAVLWTCYRRGCTD